MAVGCFWTSPSRPKTRSPIPHSILGLLDRAVPARSRGRSLGLRASAHKRARPHGVGYSVGVPGARAGRAVADRRAVVADACAGDGIGSRDDDAGRRPPRRRFPRIAKSTAWTWALPTRSAPSRLRFTSRRGARSCSDARRVASSFSSSVARSRPQSPSNRDASSMASVVHPGRSARWRVEHSTAKSHSSQGRSRSR